jgi:hypothetical protein
VFQVKTITFVLIPKKSVVVRSAITAVLLLNFNVNAQLSGTISVPGTFSTIALAIDALNLQGTSGAVTVNIAAGHTETAVAGGYSLYASGSASAPIMFRKSGTGAAPRFYAYSGGNKTPGAAVQDGIWRLIGCDHVIIDGLELIDQNTVNPSTMEFGIGFFKASASDGCQYNVIRNCSIRLSLNNNATGSAPAADGSRGIDLVNALSTSHNSQLTITSSSGSNSQNIFYGNTISGCNIGISLYGYNGSANLSLCDRDNEVGSTALGNNIFDFGGGGNNACAGIRAQYQYDLGINKNLIVSNTGAGTNHPGTMRGILVNNAAGANITVSTNTLTLKSGAATSQLVAVENNAGAGGTSNTVSISGNVVRNCTYAGATSGSFYGIWNTASCANLFIQGNTFLNNSTMAGSGSTYLIYNSGLVNSLLDMSGNHLTFKYAGFNAYTGTMYNLYCAGGATTASINLDGNFFSNIYHTKVTGAGTIYLINNTADAGQLSVSSNTCDGLVMNHSAAEYFINNNGSVVSQLNVTGNVFTNYFRTASWGNFYGYYCTGSSPATCVQTFSNNVFTDISAPVAGAGVFYGIYSADGNNAPYPRKIICGNVFRKINVNAGGNCYLIFAGNLGDAFNSGRSEIYDNSAQDIESADLVEALHVAAPTSGVFAAHVYSNSITSVMSHGSASSVLGFYLASNNAGLEFYSNRVGGLIAGGSSGTAYGIYGASTTTTTAFNNIVGGVAAPGASGASRVNGIYISAGARVELLHNTVHLEGSGTGTDFGSNALHSASTVSLLLKNNIFINSSVPTGTGVAAAFRRSTSGIGNYLAASDHNLFYAGTPGSQNVILDNGTKYQSIAAFKTFVSPREANTVSQAVQFRNTFISSANFLHVLANVPQIIESTALALSTVSGDIDSQVRHGHTGYAGSGSAPDLGADEFEQDLQACVSANAGTPVVSSHTICEGKSVILECTGFTPGSGILHQWQFSGSASGSYSPVTGGVGINSPELVTSSMAAGTYYFKLQSTCTLVSASATSSFIKVKVAAIPSASAAVIPSVACAGQTVQLTGMTNAGSKFRWHGPEGFYSSLQSPAILIDDPYMAGNYSLVVYNGSCASLPDTLSLNVESMELECAAFRSILCAGGSSTLSAVSPGSSFLWSNGATTGSIVVSPSVSTVYSVVATSSANCHALREATITVISPAINGTGTVSCLAGDSVSLSVQAFSPSITSWYASSTSTSQLGSGNSIVVSPTVTTTFYAEAQWKQDDSLIAVSSGTSPFAHLMFDITALNDISVRSIDLYFNSAGSTSVEVWGRHGSYGGFQSSSSGWSKLAGLGMNVSGGSPQALVVPPVAVLAGQSYAFYITVLSGPALLCTNGNTPGTVQEKSNNIILREGVAGGAYFNVGNNPGAFNGKLRFLLDGCTSARVPVTVTVSSAPVLTLTADPSSVCAQQNVTLSVNGAVSYTWNVAATGSMIVVKPLNGSVYSVTGVSGAGCTGTATLSVPTLSLPIINITPSTGVVCPSSKITFTGTGATTFTWSTGTVSNVVNVFPAAPSVYTVQATDVNGCVDDATVSVSTRTLPVIKISQSRVQTCPGEEVNLNASGALTYTWYPGGITGNSLQAFPAVSSVFNAVGLSVNGCTNISMALVEVDPCVSLQETGGKKLSVFPDPARDYLVITTGSDEIMMISLYNSLGIEVMPSLAARSPLKLDVSSLPAGLFYVRLFFHNKEIIHKFVISR